MALFVEATADDFSATPGQSVELTMELVNRSAVDAKLKNMVFQPMELDTAINMVLENNQAYKFYKKVVLPNDMKTTSPYWLKKKGALGMYVVENQLLRGKPETPRSFKVSFTILVEGQDFEITVPVVYKKTDPVKGEIYRPFEVTPPVFSNIKDQVYVFADNEPKTVKVIVKAGKDDISGKVALVYPMDWRLEPDFHHFSLKQKG